MIVHYAPGLAADQLAQLRQFITGPQGGRVVAAADPQQTETVKAVNAYNSLLCAEFDLDALTQFTASWFQDPRSRTVE